MKPRAFGELHVHESKHPTWGHKFNPYDNRPTHKLDKSLFDAMIDAFPEDCSLTLDYFFVGLIDAPEKIPMGSTECIRTIGGFEREEYRNLPRGTEDWKVRAVAEQEVSAMLKKILEETP